MTIGGSGGMAGRGGFNKPGRGRTRSGLRSQVSVLATTEEAEEVAHPRTMAKELEGAAAIVEDREGFGWNTEESEEDVQGYENLGVRPKQEKKGSRKARWSAEPPRTTTMPDEPTLVDMFKNFLIGQQRREGVLVREIQQLKTAITMPNLTAPPVSQNANPPLNLPSDGSLRVQTPTDTQTHTHTQPLPDLKPQHQILLRLHPEMLPTHLCVQVQRCFLSKRERTLRTFWCALSGSLAPGAGLRLNGLVGSFLS